MEERAEFIKELMRAFITFAVLGTAVFLEMKGDEIPPTLAAIGGVCVAHYFNGIKKRGDDSPMRG